MAVTEILKSLNFVEANTATVDATGLNSSDSFDTSSYAHGTFQVIWAGITGTATFEVQVSMDRTNYDTIASTSTTTSGAAGSGSIVFQNHLPGGLLRITITSAAGAGTLQAYAVMKRAR